MTRSEKEFFMQAALNEARKGWGKTHPQPMIGAVLVENGKIVATDHLDRSGSRSPETRLLEGLGSRPSQDASLFLTLEPGPSSNRLESGVKAIVESGLKNVFIGASDPVVEQENKGSDALKDAGIRVERRILIEDCEDLNLIFNHWVNNQTPILASKSATTLDGKIACRTGESKWITGEDSRQNVM